MRSELRESCAFPAFIAGPGGSTGFGLFEKGTLARMQGFFLRTAEDSWTRVRLHDKQNNA